MFHVKHTSNVLIYRDLSVKQNKPAVDISFIILVKTRVIGVYGKTYARRVRFPPVLQCSTWNVTHNLLLINTLWGKI